MLNKLSCSNAISLVSLSFQQCSLKMLFMSTCWPKWLNDIHCILLATLSILLLTVVVIIELCRPKCFYTPY